MDRNQVIGFILLAGLLVAYIVYNNNAQQQYLEQKRADSAAQAKVHPKSLDSTASLVTASTVVAADSAGQQVLSAYKGEEKHITFENYKINLVITTKEGFTLSAQIKEYKTYDQNPLYLFDGAENMLSMVLPLRDGALATSDLYYEPELITEASGGQSLRLLAQLEDGKQVALTYTLPADEYMMQCKIATIGMGQDSRKINWTTQSLHTERDIANERANSQIYFRFMDGDHDYFTITEDKQETLESKTHWVGFRMHFFSTALIAKEGFSRAEIRTTNKLDDRYVTRNRTDFTISPTTEGNASVVDLNWYIGPNHYTTLKSYKMDLDDMVPLGYGI